MPRSCSSSDMAGTAMLYPPGTDGAAVTDVRLHGSRPSQHPELRNTTTQWNPGFTAFGRASGRFHCVWQASGSRPMGRDHVEGEATGGDGGARGDGGVGDPEADA